MTKAQIFPEILDFSEATFDADHRLLRNVILIKEGESQNERYYPHKVLIEAAALFNDAKAYDGHKRGPRSVSEITGWYANVRFDEGKLLADRYFSTTDAGRNVMSIAQDIVEGRAPKTLAGLSINAIGTGKPQKLPSGKTGVMVESITGVTSVDDVDSPAAGGAYLLTAGGGDDLTLKVLQAMTFEEWVTVNPKFTERVQNEMKLVRQDEAIKAAQAEAGHNLQTLKAAQATIDTLMQENEATMLELQQVRRELAIERALEGSRLPATHKNDLRDRFKTADPGSWVGIIERETEKAKASAPRPSVSGAAAQTSAPLPFAERVTTPVPRDDEDSESWARRMASYRR